MFRFLCKLFKIDFEPCKGCEARNQQLQIANEQVKYLTETLVNIVNPKTTVVEPEKTVDVRPISGSFARRRAALEERDRNEARLMQQNQFIAKPDKGKEVKDPIFNKTVPLGQQQSIEELEKELGVEEEVKNG